MTGRNGMFVTGAVVAGLVAAAASAGAQAPGGPVPREGFSVERLVQELSSFLPEEYARLRAAPGGQGQQGAQPQAGLPQAGQRPGGLELPRFKRDPGLMLTARQVDALLPVLFDLQKTPFPTPSQAKKVTATVDATLTKQQKDASGPVREGAGQGDRGAVEAGPARERHAAAGRAGTGAGRPGSVGRPRSTGAAAGPGRPATADARHVHRERAGIPQGTAVGAGRRTS